MFLNKFEVGKTNKMKKYKKIMFYNNLILLIFFMMVSILFLSCNEGSKSSINQISSEKTKSIYDELQIKDTIDNTIGLLVLSSEFSEDSAITFYNLDNSVWKKFKHCWTCYDLNQDISSDFDFYAFAPDYFLLVVRVTNVDNKYFYVIVNERGNLIKKVSKNNKNLIFENWQEHLFKSVTAVDFDINENPLLKEPDEKAAKIEINYEKYVFIPIELKGDWLKVRWLENGEEGGEEGYGWIKWKDKNKLMVELNYLC